MSEFLVFAAFLSFVIFFALGQNRKYAAVAGWCCIVLNLWSELPAFFLEDNFLYPVLALLSLPFLAITTGSLLHNDPAILRLSRSAAIATLIYVPFAVVQPLHDLLIRTVVGQALTLITVLGHHPQLYAWDVITENGFYNQIILGCTGIFAIAMLLGIAFGSLVLSKRQILASFLLVVPVIWILNLLRVSIVFIAVSDAWFAGFPDPRPGATVDANFFWAHNVFAELLAILVLLLLVRGLIWIIPGLSAFARDLVISYREVLCQFTGTVRDQFRH
jgi:archaeosortase A (PGF-CTERM-specific)